VLRRGEVRQQLLRELFRPKFKWRLSPIKIKRWILSDGISYKDIEFLKMELRSIQAALRMVGVVPPEQLPQHVKNWADLSREASYDIQDILDIFRVQVEAGHPGGLVSRMASPFLCSTRGKARREIADAIRDIKTLVNEIGSRRAPEIAERRNRYRVDAVDANPAATSVDSRLVGTDVPRDDIINRMDMSDPGLKMVSIVGMGGVGKTTLARAAWDHPKVKKNFENRVWVTVSKYSTIREVLQNIAQDLLHDNTKVNPFQILRMDENTRRQRITSVLSS